MTHDPLRHSARSGDPCPGWCTGVHPDEAHAADRYHDSEPTLVPVIVFERPSGAGSAWQQVAATLTIVTSRHVDAVDAMTFIGRADRTGQQLVLTTESASRLVEALSSHIETILQTG